MDTIDDLTSLLDSAKLETKSLKPLRDYFLPNGKKMYPIHLTSYSSRNTGHTCLRKLEIYKMGNPVGFDESSTDLAFGSAVGDGVQALMRGESLEKAWLIAFMAWSASIFDVDIKGKKSLGHALEAIRLFVPYGNILSQDWELYEFTDKKTGERRKATELSAIVHLPNGFVDRSYIDVVLRNNKTGRLLVFELKTTKYEANEANYKNSNQTLGYGIILDSIADVEETGSEFEVYYAVFSSKLEDWKIFSFVKDRLAKAEWLQTVLFETNKVQECVEAGFFPKHGENCFNFFRQCDYFNACDMSKTSLYASEEVLTRKVMTEMEEKFDFEFTFEELVDQQLAEVRTHG